MKEPKTKAEPRVQIKLNVPKSLADACEAAKQEATNTPYDWNATMVEKLEKNNAEFRQFLAQYKTKSQANSRLNPSPISSRPNGADSDRA